MKKHLKFSTRKKLYIFLGVGLSAIAGGTTALLLSSLTKNPRENNQNVLQFGLLKEDYESGATLTGNTQIKFKKSIQLNEIGNLPIPKKTVIERGLETEVPFVDWVDENGQVVRFDQQIQAKKSTTKIYATFADYWQKQGVRLVTVKFTSNNQNDIFVGTTTVSVPIGRTIGTINQPRVLSKQQSITRTFTGWKIKDTSIIQSQTAKITTDLILIPTFEVDVNFTFHPTSEGKITQGESIVPTKDGTSFSEINQPVVECTTHSDYVFEGWYTNEDFSTKWSSFPESISPDVCNAYAKFVDPAEFGGYVINFVKNNDEGSSQPVISYTGNTKVICQTTESICNVNKPGISCSSNYRLAGWEMSEDGSTDWHEIDISQPYSGGKSSIYLRPIMVFNVDKVDVVGPAYAPRGFSTSYTAYVSPQTEKQDTRIRWELRTLNDGKVSTDVATISDAGELKVKPGGGSTTIKVRAISTLNESIYGEIQVTLDAPYANSSDMWTCLGTGNLQSWYKLKYVCDPDEPEIVAIDTSTGTEKVKQTWARTEFNAPVYIGDEIKILPSAFLAGCSAFNNTIVLNNVNIIDSGFMNDCTSYNQQLDLQKVQHILNFFMKGCTAFNNASTTTSINSLNITSAVAIGNGFLEGCTSFNSPISFNTTGVKTIGDDFLHNCTKFNQNIYFPACLTSVGERCMHNCDAYTSQITVEADVENVFTGIENNLDFSTENSEADLANVGFSVNGSKAETFIKYYPSIADPGGEISIPSYRKVRRAYA